MKAALPEIVGESRNHGAVQHPSFSICIPNYNYGRYLPATLESVLTQTYPHFEVIVADNASTDNSVEVVSAFKDERIRLIQNRYNIGFAPNLDRATETARNDFLILLSSDDLMRPTALETYARVLTGLGERAAHCVLTSAIDVIDGCGAITGVSHRPTGSLYYRELGADDADRMDWTRFVIEERSGLEVLRDGLKAKNVSAAFLATCYPRRLYERVEGYHSVSRIFPDADYLYKMLAQDPILVYVPQRLFAYRVHDNNQLAAEALAGALKYQVDAYMRTVDFPQAVLDCVGIKRQELVDVFIEKAVMERGLQSLAAGSWVRALRCLAFGFAAYPGTTLKEWKTYALGGLLGLGPLGKFLARVLYARHLQRKAGKR